MYQCLTHQITVATLNSFVALKIPKFWFKLIELSDYWGSTIFHFSEESTVYLIFVKIYEFLIFRKSSAVLYL